MIRRWKQWRQRRREEPVAQRAMELREFVYLDEVSIISLLSSRLGKLPSEFTDTLTNAKKAELNTSSEANAAIVKSRLGARYEASWTENSQVLSKATIQATFKRLYDEEEGSLVLQPVLSSNLPPSVDKIQRMLDSGASDSEMVSWFVEPAGLKRGQLAEVEVELQADPAFRVSAIVTTFKEITDESAELIAQADRPGFEKAIELNRVLEKLMAGLIPLKCRVVDYDIVTIGQEEYLIHRRALKQLPETQRPPTRPLYLVGVTEQSLFWKDIRRVLFSKARFRVLCRLNYDGLRTSWTPVKMVDVVGEITPDLEREMDMFGPGALKTMMESSAMHGKFVEPRMRALTTYSELLAQHLGLQLEEQDRRQIETLAGETADFLISVPEGRKAFTQIADFLVHRFSCDIDPTVSAQLRVKACHQNGLLPGGSAVRTETISVSGTTDRDEERFIDGEIIAIYW